MATAERITRDLQSSRWVQPGFGAEVYSRVDVDSAERISTYERRPEHAVDGDSAAVALQRRDYTKEVTL